MSSDTTQTCGALQSTFLVALARVTSYHGFPPPPPPFFCSNRVMVRCKQVCWQSTRSSSQHLHARFWGGGGGGGGGHDQCTAVPAKDSAFFKRTDSASDIFFVLQNVSAVVPLPLAPSPRLNPLNDFSQYGGGLRPGSDAYWAVCTLSESRHIDSKFVMIATSFAYLCALAETYSTCSHCPACHHL